MKDIHRQSLPSEHSPEDVWRGINTPLAGELGERVNPYVTIDYQGLNDEGLVQPGTLIVYTPVMDRLRPLLGMVADGLPDDIATRVEEYDAEGKLRVDVVESDKHAGRVRHRVEAHPGGTSLLVIEGELSLGGMYGMFEGTIASFAERGVKQHAQRSLDHLPIILGR